MSATKLTGDMKDSKDNSPKSGHKQSPKDEDFHALMLRFRSTLDHMLEGCQLIGFDWKYLYLNKTAEIHNRRSNQELLGKKYMDAWPGIEKMEVFQLMKDCMENREPHQMENKFEYADGSIGWFNLNIQPVPDGIFVLSIDITEQKTAQETLLNREKLYKQVFENNLDALILSSPDGQIIEANPATSKLFGWTKKEICQLTRNDILDLSDPRLSRALDSRNRKGFFHGELTGVRKDGSHFPIELASNIFRDNKGTKLTSAFIHDQTKQKEIEAQLRKMNRVYALISQINQAIVRIKDQDKILEEACRIAIDHGKFKICMEWSY